jgi:hypothetical protein
MPRPLLTFMGMQGEGFSPIWLGIALFGKGFSGLMESDQGLLTGGLSAPERYPFPF